MPQLDKILIANRGEIAVRVIRSAHELGYRTVAAYSEADADAPHVALAHQAVCIGPPSALESYLNMDAILAAALKVQAGAIHPGYGFLAENDVFAERCVEAGIVFIGPPAEAIRLMGDKARAKARMIQAGVPVIPGYQGADQQAALLAAEADKLGYPLLVKAVAGGGGRGMRAVHQAAQLADALDSARAEAASAFGNGDLLLERLIERGRHVEIQVFADSHGHVLHLGERECSAQRRHQKIIEESPSPAVDADLRRRIGQTAVDAAAAIGYQGAGTVEFILGPDGAYYFLEMNTRLQVEHPVTELVTGQDLVAWQLQVAAGAELPLTQQQVELSGHAMEARIYAEDPYQGFLPQTGRVLHWRPRGGEGVRVDSGISEGQQVSAHYDPMLAKVITWGADREQARRKLITALQDTSLLGLTTNRAFLTELLRDPQFVAGEVTTDTIDQRFADQPPVGPSPDLRVQALAAVLCSLPPRDDLQTWSNSGPAAWPVLLQHEDQPLELRLTCQGQGRYLATLQQQQLQVRVIRLEGHHARVELDGVQHSVCAVRDGDALHLELDGLAWCFTLRAAWAGARQAGADSRLVAPLSGLVTGVRVSAGERVEAGQCVAVLEAMKMEHRVVAGAPGVVATVEVAQGDQVASRQLLITLELDTDDAADSQQTE